MEFTSTFGRKQHDNNDRYYFLYQKNKHSAEM